MKVQLVDSIPERWKFIIKENYENATNLIIHDHRLIKGSRVITLDKLTPIEIYSILISKVQNKPSSNIYFGNLFNDYNIDWTAIYMLPHLVTYNTYMRSFQCKILKNIPINSTEVILRSSHRRRSAKIFEYVFFNIANLQSIHYKKYL